MRMTPKKLAICRNNILVVKLLLFIVDLGLCSNHVMLVLNLQAVSGILRLVFQPIRRIFCYLCWGAHVKDTGTIASITVAAIGQSPRSRAIVHCGVS
jgi:hypothetical protein